MFVRVVRHAPGSNDILRPLIRGHRSRRAGHPATAPHRTDRPARRQIRPRTRIDGEGPSFRLSRSSTLQSVRCDTPRAESRVNWRGRRKQEVTSMCIESAETHAAASTAAGAAVTPPLSRPRPFSSARSRNAASMSPVT